MRFHDPIIPGFHPDPSICRAGDDFYLATSTFAWFPGVPIFHSRDLVHWRLIGHALDRESQLALAGAEMSGGIYAPTLRWHGGRFHMVTTNVTAQRHLYAHADDPAGPWSEPVPIRHGYIDPSLFFLDSGEVLLTSNGPGGICQAVVDLETGALLTESRTIWEGTGGSYPEGPHLYRRGDWFYLLISEGGTEYGHMVTVARSRSPWGPFDPCPHNPILTHRSIAGGVHCLGHGDLIEDPLGDWWMVHLGVRTLPIYPHYHHLGRETFLCPVSWDADGWPRAGENGRLPLDGPGPALPRHPWPACPARDEFDAPDLSLGWISPRRPLGGRASLAERPGWLRLRGTPEGLDAPGEPAFLGRRQTVFDGLFATSLDWRPPASGAEAGIAVYMDEKHHAEVAVRGTPSGREVFARMRVGPVQQELAARPLPAEGPVELRIEAAGIHYHLGFRAGDGESPGVPLATVEARYLSTEVAGGFTGVVVGLFARDPDGGAPPADFDWFDSP